MNVKFVVTACLALVVGVVGGVWLAGEPPPEQQVETSIYRCPMHPTVVSERAGECPVCGMDLVPDSPAHGDEMGSGTNERKVLHWRAPMDPNYVTDAPGKSPMGMDLIPVYEDEVTGGATVTIDPGTVQNIGVKTTRVKKESLNRTIRTIGRVDYAESRMTDVNTKVDGWVEDLFVDYTGQVVEMGQPLLEIFSPALVAAQEEYLTALDYVERLSKNASSEAPLAGARSLLSATRQRLQYWDITPGQIERLEKTRVVKRTMIVYSPQQGVVVHKAVYNGAHIKTGQHLYRIADVSKVWIYADIYEYELPWVQVGQTAEVDLSYQPGKIYSGKVAYVYPYLEAKTRTVKVRMTFDNADLTLKPEMYANVRIRPDSGKDALVIPTQSIIRSGKRNVAIMALGEGRFAPVEVTLGIESNGDVEVLTGLREGDMIVTSSHFLIDSESNLKAALVAMTSGGEVSTEGKEAPPVSHQH